MYTSMWFISIAAILVVDVRTGALLQKDVEPRRCYQCAHNDSTCLGQAPAPCPARSHHCATIAVPPAYTSTLGCAAPTAHPCSLALSSEQALTLTCTCGSNHCNSPFLPEIKNQLLNFTSSVNTTKDLTDMFFKSFVSVTENKLYEAITIQTKPTSQSNDTPIHVTTHVTHIIEHLNDLNAPRAEALKHEATEPSDDEEDEGEGSGSYEETRLRRPASAPAAPSSYLPANENAASLLSADIIIMTVILFVTL